MKLKYIVLDVDGTLTDSGVYYDNLGNELKKFSTKDGVGIVLAKKANIIPIVLTGRECLATSRRMAELGVKEIYQNINDKEKWIKKWIEDNRIDRREIGYIGDDLNDIVAMKLCGFVGCPLDACKEVKEIADYISKVEGGHGAVRDVIEYLLKEDNIWEETIQKTYGLGI